ncbi:tyrosine-type recombinase/integrase [Propioniciclava coleopterorum]|uniref:Tyrosine-type recombinase/integrase n=1 Tax=Propioniciclava coleopterorum TaxID=2714937 RepID=A0A6G7Y2V6_9ACTN|nr:tyrosine-type recombinase/integrase [Propioniciclava coleopterorum]QIK70978.1 tyrosine-type recombinase/integrase [Propioniciclava coleopterorum]
MTDLAPLLQRFFTDKLDGQMNASTHTKAAYADTFRLLLLYAQKRTGTAPSALTLADLDADLVGGFLQYLEDERGNSAATRNARRAALRSFFDYASYRAPDAIVTISQVLAIPAKRTKKTLVSFLTGTEAEALIAAPDTTTWLGRRDRLLLHLGIQTGLRVTELISLRLDSIELGPQSQLRCLGKGRKHRVIPLQKPTVRLLTAWITELATSPEAPLFSTSAGTPLTRAAVAKLVARHAATAAEGCPSLTDKNITPHTLRHTCAMMLLHAGIDTASIALWLGHATIQTTQVYLHADLELKRRTLDRLPTIGNRPPARYQASDALIAFLTDR